MVNEDEDDVQARVQRALARQRLDDWTVDVLLTLIERGYPAAMVMVAEAFSPSDFKDFDDVVMAIRVTGALERAFGPAIEAARSYGRMA